MPKSFIGFTMRVAIALGVALSAVSLTSFGEESQSSGYLGRGIYLPPMNPARGRELFVAKGCVVCHRVNGVGGELAPRLDASAMQGHLNPFVLVAKMWSGAEGMIALQKDLLGDKVQFQGQELADLIGFLHDENEQSNLTDTDLSTKMRRLVKEWSP